MNRKSDKLLCPVVIQSVLCLKIRYMPNNEATFAMYRYFRMAQRVSAHDQDNLNTILTAIPDLNAFTLLQYGNQTNNSLIANEMFKLLRK